MTQTATAGIGHNNPPELEEIIAEGLQKDYREELSVYESMLAKQDEMPDQIDDDETAGAVSDYLKKLRNMEKTLDAARKAEKEVYSAKANAVHAFFKKRLDSILSVRDKVGEPLADYLKRKEDAARREREEKARAAAEEARRKAEEMEARRKAEEEARRKAEEEAAAARRAQEEAERRAEEERRKAEQARREAEEAKARAKQEEQEKEAATARAKELEAEARQREKAAKEAERAAAAQAKEREEQAKQAARDAKQANRDYKTSLDDAIRADKKADQMERKTFAKSSELSRTRGSASMASVKETWVGSITRREDLDIEALRDHIPFAALEQAVQSFVNAGGRQLRGAIITQETKSVVR